MKQLLFAATAAIALAATPLAADASVMTVTLSGFGAPLVSPASTTGAVSFGPVSYGSFNVNQVSAQDQSVLAVPGILNSNSLNIAGLGSAPGVLTINVTSTGLIGFNQAIGLSSFAVNNLNGSITSVTETTRINGVTLATQTFNGIGTSVQSNPVNLGSGGTFTAEDIFVITTTGGVGNANLTIDLSGTPQPVPEPATLALLGAGLVGLGFVRKRKA
jgi:hypothetical protein